jgi:peptidoglycan/xylan/chitin deacetylase (PgdA/CDA1 family)
MLNILTIDVEDYYHVSAFESEVRRKDWDKHESRVVDNTRRLLAILKSFDVNATFFILGWVAEQHPEIVRDIAFDGHEIACHGYAHRLIYGQSKEAFREDLVKSKTILEEIINQFRLPTHPCPSRGGDSDFFVGLTPPASGSRDRAIPKVTFPLSQRGLGDFKPTRHFRLPKVLGYRAASCSITKQSLWALDILAEEGFQYDSSVYPIRHDRYGIPNSERFPWVISCDNGSNLWEFPLSTLRIMRTNIPIAGGGYFRLFPYEFTRWAIRKLNQDGHPAIVYLHPWEIDPSQPRLKGSVISRFRQYNNLDKTEKRLKALLRDFDFVPIRTFLTALTSSGNHCLVK